MKVIYVYTSASFGAISSVQTKILSQIRALNGVGLSTRGIFLTGDELPEDYVVQDGVSYYKIQPTKRKYFTSIWQRKNAIIRLSNVLRELNGDYDIILLRYTIVNWTMLQFAWKHRKRFILNHLTAEVPEIRLHMPSSDSVSIFSRLLSNLEFRWYPILNEFLFGGIIRNLARFGICNSREISDYQKSKAFGKYATYIISDGVDTASIPVKADFDFKDELRMVFLKGAMMDADYNGLDRIMEGIMKYKGRVRVSLTIIGPRLNFEREMAAKYKVGDRVMFKDFVSGIEMDREMANYNLGISTLGLHRKGIKSTSTIKSRDYCARALPFIYGHHDPDFSDDPSTANFCFEVKSDDSSIDLDEVIQFMESFKAQQDFQRSNMRVFAEKKLDYKVKMLELKSILEDEFS